MDLLLNDLSLHKQFDDIYTFRESIKRVMSLRNLANRLGCRIYSNKRILSRFVTPSTTLHQELQKLDPDERRSVLRWLNKRGPFWDELDQHSPNLLMWTDGEIVTETAVGEAAHGNLVGIDRALVSFIPSNWEYCPLTVKIDPDSESETDVTVSNYWQNPDLEAALRDAEPPLASWAQLAARSRAVYQRLVFFADCYNPLEGQPFAYGAAKRIFVLLGILDHMMGAVDEMGRRTAEGNRMYQKFFTGDNAWFSDSSDSEKQKFSKELTFPSPLETGESLFCTWHGKVNNPKMRIHFSWPVPPGEPIFVAYIGLKITRR